MSSMSGSQAATDPMALKLEDIASQEWHRYKTDFAPTEKQFIGQLKEIGSGREQNYLGGMAEVARQQQIGTAPNTGRANKLIKQTLLSEKSMLPEASLLQAKSRHSKGLQTAVEMGRGIGTGALGQIGRHAQIGTSRNIARAEAAGIRQRGIGDALGTFAGYQMQQGSKSPTYIDAGTAPGKEPLLQ